MTIPELIERLQWQQEGRLQRLIKDSGEWFDWTKNSFSSPTRGDAADLYRRRPDPPPMPDEVWLSESPDQGHLPPWKGPKPDTLYGANAVRYVRVGAIIPASQLQYRDLRGEYGWTNEIPANVEYRIKP